MKKPHSSSSNTPPVFKILSGSHKGKQFRLLSSEIILGSDPSCDVVFRNNASCSPLHARVSRREGICSIESMDPENPVLINKKPSTQRILSSKDKIRIGEVDMLFIEGALPPPPLPAPVSGARPAAASGGHHFKSSKPLKKLLGPALLAVLALVGAYFFLLKEEPSSGKQKKTLELKTEDQVAEELKALEEKTKQFLEEKALSFPEQQARSAFIKGFRDYGKGYFFRALKMFQHCLMVHRNSPLCQSYSQKAKAQIEKLIQKKVRLGKAYKENKQYEACRSVFKSVELMIQDSQNQVLKEAKQNRKLCESQLENRI